MLRWPGAASSACTKDPLNQMHSSKSEFMDRRQRDECWTRKKRFFDGHRELAPSIMSFDMPLHELLTPVGAEIMGTDGMAHQRTGGEVDAPEADSDALSSYIGELHDSSIAVGVFRYNVAVAEHASSFHRLGSHARIECATWTRSGHIRCWAGRE